MLVKMSSGPISLKSVRMSDRPIRLNNQMSVRPNSINNKFQWGRRKLKQNFLHSKFLHPSLFMFELFRFSSVRGGKGSEGVFGEERIIFWELGQLVVSILIDRMCPLNSNARSLYHRSLNQSSSLKYRLKKRASNSMEAQHLETISVTKLKRATLHIPHISQLTTTS